MCRVMRTNIDLKKIEIETKIDMEYVIKNVERNINRR